MAQTHLGIPLDLEFKRFAAGPFDEVIYKLEGAAKKQGWFVASRKSSKPGITYHPGPEGGRPCWPASLSGRNAASPLISCSAISRK